MRKVSPEGFRDCAAFHENTSESGRFKSMDIFVNYSAFSIDLNESREILTLKDTERFWNQIEKIKPQKFILNGDKLIFGTNNHIEFEKVKASCQQLLA